MATVTTRHIRHDWTSWVDWQENVQKSVKTMCGVKSKPHLCGIPGVTRQEKIVYKGGKPVWGWCMHCVLITWPYLMPPALTADVAPQEIIDLHLKAQRELVRQYYRVTYRSLVQARKDGRTGSAKAYEETLYALKVDFPLELANE